MLDLDLVRRDRAERLRYWRDRGVYADYTYADAIRDAMKVGSEQRLIFHSRTRPEETTAGELNQEAERIAAAFHNLGLRKGDFIAVMLPAWKETVAAYLAAFKLGLAVVPIVAVYGAREIGFIMRQTGAKALVIPDTFRGYDYLERVASVGAMPALEHLIVVGEKAPPGAILWRDLPARNGDTYPAAGNIADEVCLVIYTSGTTSDPKGVKHTHNTMLCDLNAVRAEGGQPYGPPELGRPSLCMLPAGHIAGYLLMMRPFVTPGGDTVFMEQWNGEDAARLVEKYKIVATGGGGPVFLNGMVDAATRRGIDISSLQMWALGGAPVAPENIRMSSGIGINSWRSYGMSEHTVVTTGLPDDPLDEQATTDGRLTPRNQIKIVDEAGEEVPVGEPGEICSIGPRLFVGYVDSELDKACFLPGGWYRSGDIGVMDAEGFLTVVDRKKDIIIRGGENISAKEVEDVLVTMPGVVEAAAVAMPDPDLGERICVYLAMVPGATMTLEDVAKYFREAGMSRVKTPERLIVVEGDFPRTPSGKIKKHELRAALRAEAAAAKSA
jgi:acyl-CoA synthetase (AMP-forming)/AMP-acid ligase II